MSTLLVTSAQPGEGKTTTAANLGIVMAQAGKKVILVDSDLRRPALHKAFGASNGYGFTNLLLQDQPDLSKAMLPTEVENLRLE
ncbi:MAG: P-loop NTPase [Chloroflexi bacterium]|nr:P-loop NTPase [Chloroflexota bacterium]